MLHSKASSFTYCLPTTIGPRLLTPLNSLFHRRRNWCCGQLKNSRITTETCATALLLHFTLLGAAKHYICGAFMSSNVNVIWWQPFSGRPQALHPCRLAPATSVKDQKHDQGQNQDQGQTKNQNHLSLKIIEFALKLLELSSETSNTQYAPRSFLNHT